MTNNALKRALEIEKEIEKSVNWRMSALDPKSTFNKLIKETEDAIGNKYANDIANYIHLKHIEKVDKLREEFNCL